MKKKHMKLPFKKGIQKLAQVIRKYGWKPDIPDQRDFMLGDLRPTPSPKKLPPIVDLRPLCSTVEDQGSLGSCTANAIVGNLEYLENLNKNAFKDFSRLFVYYNEREMEGQVEFDSGAMIRDGIKTLVKVGACYEETWPYNIDRFAVKPAPFCYKEALAHTFTHYHRINTLNEMLSCLAEGYPFVFGITIYESFETEQVAQTGIVPMPKPTERTLGGHAVMAVGYNMKDKRFIIRNSWGTGWGQQGYFTIPFDYLIELGSDFWTVRTNETTT